MKTSPFIYLRGLRHAEHTVFAVNDGQKYFTDPQFGRRMAYSSGQQVKRSIIEALNLPFAAITFNWEIDKKDKKANQKEPHSPCDPTFADQLLGGYMKAESGSFTVKRRSPLSISAMRPLHPLLGGIEYPTENLTFDRTSHPEHHRVNVYWLENGKRGAKLEDNELSEWLTTNKRSLPNRAFIQDQTRASGLFVYDIAIDLRTLFCVSTNKLEPELFPHIEEKLKEQGWIESQNVFGKCLVCPLEKRKEIISSLAHSLINWRITSNQARTFSLMETVAIAISDNANQIAYAIRGDLREDTERQQAIPKIDETTRAELFITPIASSYVAGSIGSADAIDKAEERLVELMLNFDYEHQL
ncbi:CRISPR-associated protein Cas7 [Cytophagaceae bacterium DM2B3-1]|uniref:CRISPR-associated protein Cas7 n=1 Tax=Xanthocytophaga flava TaxID=3048013 RepID=A0ABT7CT79_9BACT|nr:CRISPR-associated protein Cas7 [Xanthocytophaga flavus]MDJ1496932.1 CRISPR-associated protein Cas7 [Xanthocytophaga flavus]